MGPATDESDMRLQMKVTDLTFKLSSVRSFSYNDQMKICPPAFAHKDVEGVNKDMESLTWNEAADGQKERPVRQSQYSPCFRLRIWEKFSWIDAVGHNRNLVRRNLEADHRILQRLTDRDHSVRLIEGVPQ